MQYAIIDNGKVVSKANSDQAFGENWVASDEARIGDLYDGVNFTTPPIDWSIKAREVRSTRNDLLFSSDWTQLSDSTADKVAWATYRQELRDLTKQPDFPQSFTMPTSP